MNRKGFTLVEIMAVVALIAIISVAAILGVNSIINKQRMNTATASEKNIGEAALTTQTEKHKLYLPACVDKTNGNYVDISEMIVKKINDDLRAQMISNGKTTIAQKEQFIKDYVKSINDNEDNKKNFASDYFGVKDINCFKVTSVADMIKEGYLKDLDNGCDTASLIVIYNRGDSTNTAGNLKAVQETGICKGSSSEEKGPIITINPERDLSSTATKKVKITAVANETKLESNLVLKYGWSKSLRNKPASWETVNLVGNDKKVSAEVTKTGADEEFYLWIAAGSVRDNKKYSNTTFATGPYAFLPTPTIKYYTKYTDNTFNDPIRGHNRCNAETKCHNKTKVVVYTKPYGKNVKGEIEELCSPECPGYDLTNWRYQELKITNSSKVVDRNNHTIIAEYSPKTFTVTYDSNGGNDCSPKNKSVIFDKEYGALCATDRRGYTVVGEWFTEPGGGTAINSTTRVTTPRDHTIYKHWEPNPFYIAYNGNGATSGSIARHRCIYDDQCYLANNGFARTDYTFNGYKRENTGEAKKEGESIKNTTWERDATVTYYVQWCRNCINPSNGSCSLNASTPGTCTYTTTCNTGYHISSGNATYNPTCTINTYTVTYSASGASNIPSNQTKTYGTNLTLSSTKPTKTDYTFNGWKDNDNDLYNAGGTYTKNKNITMTAQWCRNCASVTNGSCSLNANTAGTCTYSTSCDAGYHISAGDGKYNPTCSGNTFTVKYDGNGNNGGSTAQHNCTYGAECKAASNGFTRTNASFAGWKKNNTGDTIAAGTSIKNAVQSGTVTYYAQWSCNTGYHWSGNNCVINTYTVKISRDTTHISAVSLDGSTSTLSKTVNHGTQITITAAYPNYHRFTKWSDGDPNRTRTITVTKDLDLKALGRYNILTMNYRAGQARRAYRCNTSVSGGCSNGYTAINITGPNTLLDHFDFTMGSEGIWIPGLRGGGTFEIEGYMSMAEPCWHIGSIGTHRTISDADKIPASYLEKKIFLQNLRATNLSTNDVTVNLYPVFRDYGMSYMECRSHQAWRELY